MNYSSLWKTFALLFTICMVMNHAEAAPQAAGAGEVPMPYEYTYTVKDPEKDLFFSKNELGDESGKVSGEYKVWLADGRLMTVSYTVDGESGFVPKISFEDNAKPI